MEISAISQKINYQINQANNILLVTHQRPDADGLGSLVAFSFWLNSINKKHLKFCLDQPPNNLSLMVNFQPLVSDRSILAKEDFDLVVILDSSDLNYAGVDWLFSVLPKKPTVINIDHHATNHNFGDINLADQYAVSTTQIIYQIFKSLKIKITPPIANALLAGIIYDTYNFTNPNTNHQSLEIASSLLLLGASLTQVSDAILKNKTVAALQIWGKILLRLNYNPKYGIVSTVITPQDVALGVNENEVTDGVANFLNNLTGIKAALILEQQPDGKIKGSFRTNDDLIDVSKLAKILGGGGHKKAAGFKLTGQLVMRANGSWQIV